MCNQRSTLVQWPRHSRAVGAASAQDNEGQPHEAGLSASAQGRASGRDDNRNLRLDELMRVLPRENAGVREQSHPPAVPFLLCVVGILVLLAGWAVFSPW